MLLEAINHISVITPQYKCRPVLSYACLFLLLICFADTSDAQSPTAPTVSISLDQPNATVWEGDTIRFKVEIDRPLEDGEELSVVLKYSSTSTNVPTQGASVSKVADDDPNLSSMLPSPSLRDPNIGELPGSGNNSGVELANLDIEMGDTTIFQTTVTFVGADGAQTAILQWKFGNDNVLGEDRNAEIVIDSIESNNISPEPVIDPDNGTLAVTVWEDEYRIDFEVSTYVLQEADMGGELKLIISGGDRVTNFGLQTTTTVMFTYLDFSATGECDDENCEIDYTRVYEDPDSLTIPPNTTSSLVEIAIEDDQFLEINELFRIEIEPENLPDRLSASSADIIIRDDDDVVVNITARRSSVIAGSPAIFTITRTPPRVAPDEESNNENILLVSISTTFTIGLRVIEINDDGVNYAPSVTITTSALADSATETTATIEIPVGETEANYSVPTVDDGDGKSSSELRVSISEDELISERDRQSTSLRLIVGDSSETSLLVLSPRTAAYIDLKVLPEGLLRQ